jgi:methionyl-tRNA formyltransferase
MGETVTGNTTMLLEEGLDTGPILLQQALAIFPQQTAADLLDVLAVGGAPLVVKTLAGLENGTIEPRPQNPAGVSLAPLLTREVGRMDFAAHTAMELYNRWRGFQPWPGAFTTLDGKKLIVHRMEVVDAPASQESTPAEPALTLPGAMRHGQIHIQDHRLLVACAGNTWLELVEVQLEGKKRLAAAEFLRGISLAVGARFGALTQ